MCMSNIGNLNINVLLVVMTVMVEENIEEYFQIFSLILDDMLNLILRN